MEYNTLRVSRDLHTKLKIAATKQQRLLTDVTEEAVREWLERQGNGYKKEETDNGRQV